MNELDKDQKAAIEFDDALVLAGPGSGKTRTLTAKAVKEWEAGRTVFVVTFTVSAAEEIQKRIEELSKGLTFSSEIHVSTLHAMCLDIMKEAGLNLELTDESAMEDIALEVKQSLRLKISNKRVKELLAEDGTLDRSRAECVFCNAVEKHMAENGLISYNGMLHLGLAILGSLRAQHRKGPNVSYLIDEAQDSAPMDLKIYDILQKSGAHLWMVGDLQQSIFGFRHKQKADVWQWWNPEREEFGDKACPVHTLPANYRSSKAVVKALNLINQEFVPRVESVARPDSPAGDVTMNVTENEVAMLSSVAYKVNTWIEAKEYLNEIAVLCRTNSQAATVAGFLESVGIRVRKRKKDAPTRVPARLWAALSLYIKPESDWRALRWLLMDNERIHLEAVVRKAAKEMKPLISFYHPSLLTSERGVLMWPSWMDLLGVPKSEQSWFYERADSFGGYGWQSHSWDEIMLRLFEVAVDPEEGNGVTVITIHAAKGREWNRVIVPYADSHTFGHKDKNEEERIFFVAASRAIESLALYYARQLPDQWSNRPVLLEECDSLKKIKIIQN